MPSALVISIALALAGVIASESGAPACNSLKPASLDYQWLTRWSPYKIFRSTVDAHQCGQAVFVGPAGDSTSYTGTGIVINGNFTLTYDFNLIDKSLFRSVFCSNDVKTDFQSVYVNDKSPIATTCVVTCNKDDGTKYDAVICCGRTAEDERDIDNFLQTTLKGVKGIRNSQSGCPKPRYCDTFTN